MKNPCQFCEYRNPLCKFLTTRGIQCIDKTAYLIDRQEDYFRNRAIKCADRYRHK